MALIIVDAGDPQKRGWDVAARIMNEPFGTYLRFRVRPRGIDWRVLGDELPRFARLVHEHGAGKHKLLNVEAGFGKTR